jgi:hypothetical protein
MEATLVGVIGRAVGTQPELFPIRARPNPDVVIAVESLPAAVRRLAIPGAGWAPPAFPRFPFLLLLRAIDHVDALLIVDPDIGQIPMG